MIYHDPTEDRAKSRMPVEFFAISRELGDLEKHTGADVLISPYDDKPLPKSLRDIPPHMLALERQCQDGILLQIKRGNDLLSSIARLSSIQARMNVWSPQAWLVVTRLTHKGEIVRVDNKKAYGQITWSHVSGSFNAWRLRGGSVASELATDGEIVNFVLSLERKLKEYLIDDTKAVSQKGHVQSLQLVDRNWLNTFSAWPSGIGPKSLQVLAVAVNKRGTEPSLYNVIAFVLSGQADAIKGWGKKKTASVRAWWGYHGGDVKMDRIDLNKHLNQKGDTYT